MISWTVKSWLSSSHFLLSVECYCTEGIVLCYACVITGTVNGSAQYELSKAIIITFYINNYIDEDQNIPAKQWEAA